MQNFSNEAERLAWIRAEEKQYHDLCYTNYRLFEPGSWLHRPVKTVMELLENYKGYANLDVLDLGAGIGRNSIPIAGTMKCRQGKVVAVDLLVSAIEQLHKYSEAHGVVDHLEAVLSDIESFVIKEQKYDIILAVSALEHLRSQHVLEKKLQEMALGTKAGGANCIIIGTNIRETAITDNQAREPMFEINLPTDQMLVILDQCYEQWTVQQRDTKPLTYEIQRMGQPVRLEVACITYVAMKQ